LGAFVAVTVLTQWGLPLLPGLAAVALAVAAAGWLFQRLAYQPIRDKPLLAIIICTAMVGAFVRSGALLVWGPYPRMYYLLLAVTALLALAAVRLRDSTFGRAFMAVRDNELAADVVGVPTTTVKTLAFALGAVYAGLAGALYAHLLRYISPDVFGFEQSLLMLSMLVVGGLGHLSGALVGAVVGVVLPEALRVFGVYYIAVYAVIVVAVIVFMSLGIAGTLLRAGAGADGVPPRPASLLRR